MAFLVKHRADSQCRIVTARPPGSRSPNAVVAAALLFVVASLALCACSAGPTASIPSSPVRTAPVASASVTAINGDLHMELVGAWLDAAESPRITFLQIFYPDGTVRGIDNATTLLNPATFTSDNYRLDGDTLVLEEPPDQGKSCTRTSKIDRLPDGTLQLEPQVLSNTCAAPGWGQQKLTRLSPASSAGNALSPLPQDPGAPLSDSILLQGVWLVQGTGELFVYDEKSAAQYRLDSKGQIGTTPDDRGTLAITDNGDVTLSSEGGPCKKSTTLTHAVVHGTPPDAAIHVTVAQDPCQRFAGHSDLTLLHII